MALTKVKKEKVKGLPSYPISNWSCLSHGVKALYINPSWGINFYDGMSLDVEDDGQGNFVGIGIYDPKLNVCYYWNQLHKGTLQNIPRFIGHNGISDIFKLQKWGFKVTEKDLLWDTQLMAHYLDSSRKQYGLKALAKQDLGIEYPSYKDLVYKGKGKSVTLKDLPEDLVSEYNAMDCLATYKLAEKQGFNGNPAPSYYTSYERPAAVVFAQMEKRGIQVDLVYLNELKDKLETQVIPIKLQLINELGSINLDSPKQLLGALNAKGITPILKGKPSTDKRALEKYKGQYKVVDTLFAYSELSTLLSNFVYPYLERGKEANATDSLIVHPYFHQVGTRTGRPSCSNPNLLQIPRRTENGKLVRRMFKAREGRLFGDLDFGQIEPRILAHLSKDKVLCNMFNSGVDFHAFTSERLGIDRERAKVLNLSVGYRATYKSVSQQMKCSWNEAQKVIDAWWNLFPELHDWEEKLIYEAKKSGICTTLLGRQIKVEELNTSNEWRKEGAERQLINNIAQGSAAEIMKLAMVNVDKAEIDILVQVYDELLIEAPEQGIQQEVIIACNLMENSYRLEVPLTVDAGIGPTWAEAKP